jgi:diadenylate cyclase
MVNMMTDLMHNTGWILDLLDIALVAFVIYRIFLLIRETIPTRFIAATTLLLLVALISRFVGLRAFSLVLDNLFGSVIIILVIIFQHDIRRLLVAMRRKSPDEGHGHEDVHDFVDEIASAAEALALKKIGALIVLEREMSLNNLIAVGTEIDAKVTSELITSIFLPYSPIHDGAVIIQKGKLTKAGCFLPLTQNPAVGKSVGTRHRAAIGLTETVDAVVVVVSEESGKISVVVDGKLVGDLASELLRKVVRKLMTTRLIP